LTYDLVFIAPKHPEVMIIACGFVQTQRKMLSVPISTSLLSFVFHVLTVISYELFN